MQTSASPAARNGAAVDLRARAMSEQDRKRAYGLEFRFLFREFFAEKGAFLALCLYYCFEYARFQTIYPQIDVLPYGSLTAAFALVLLVNDKLWSHPRNMLVYSVYGGLILTFISMLYAIDADVAAARGYLYLNWLVVFFLTISLVTTERRFAFFLLLYLLWNFKMSQYGARTWAERSFGFAGWGISGPAGWFQNSGELGLQMAMICVISLGYFLGTRQYLSGWRWWVMLAIPVTAFMSVMASSTRGDYLAMAAALIWLPLASKGKRMAAAVLVIVVLLVGYWAMPPEMLQRFEVAGEDYTSTTRQTRWNAGFEIFRENPLLGVGTGSWVAYYELHFPREEGREGWGLPHNSFIEVIGEHGSLGLIFWCLIFWGMFVLNRRTRRLAEPIADPMLIWTSRGLDAATVAFLIGGSFMSVFWYPYVWVHAATIVSLNTVAQARAKAAETKPESSAEAAAPGDVRAPALGPANRAARGAWR